MISVDTGSFNLLKSPLEGTHLIEAGAGTGKTYTITGLFLRLILEKNLSVDEILVVTFTEAATGELKERIRNRLKEAVHAFSGGPGSDAVICGLVKRYEDPGRALRILRAALRAFDQAAIFTIHGFCRRMLHENAFESGSLFDTELVTEQEALKKEIIYDFWRMHFYKASPLFVNYAVFNRCSPESLLSLLGNRLAHPCLKIIPQVEIPDSRQQEEQFKACFDNIHKTWGSVKAEVEEILLCDKSLNRNRYRKAGIPSWIDLMDHYASSDGNNPFLFKDFVKFTASELRISVKKGHAPPVHPFFEACEELSTRQEALKKVFEQRLIGLQGNLFRYAEDELAGRKTDKNIHFFDDLLLKLHDALKGKGGEGLAKSMRTRFKAALIDEFQDTDPIQYEIFTTAFGSEDRTLFLIGDPKQAIYGFRGADIFAYMKAAKDVTYKHTLTENWRSEPGLINAVNAVFSRTDRPFVYEEILFKPAVPADGPKSGSFDPDQGSGPPLKLWLLDPAKAIGSEPGTTMTKKDALALIPKAVAAEISRLLIHGISDGACSEKRLVAEGDIAVLVRTNSEARLIQKALSDLNIPGVLYSKEDLFDSREAGEMETLLSGIFEPGNENRVKSALATDIIGIRGEELETLGQKDGAEWENRQAGFKSYNDLWKQRGFLQMFRRLLSQENVLPRYITLPEGERRTTNLLHLSEILHKTSVENKLDPAGLLNRLSEQMEKNTLGPDEHLLRLESDENAVKIVTVHKSKGLEYPVVFCPFAWQGSRIARSKEPFLFHDENDEMRLTLDLGSEQRDRHRVFAEKELLAEDIRLLYVALTRAKSRCYLVWGRIKDADTSAIAYLFHQPGSLEGVSDAVGEKSGCLEDMSAELESVRLAARGHIGLADMPLPPAEKRPPFTEEDQTLIRPDFKGNIVYRWGIASFSSLTSHRQARDETADRDAISDHKDYGVFDKSGQRERIRDIFSFPRGVKAGIFMHDIFEHLDFAEKDISFGKKLVGDKLKQYGFKDHWLDTIYNMVTNVLSTPLNTGSKELRLSYISNKNRLNELEFYFPLKTISPERLRLIFEETTGTAFAPAKAMGRLDFSPTNGFMRGFIDLVFEWQDHFYLVDWKSNFLGTQAVDYDQKSLKAAMDKGAYLLQYTIYTLALDQYLGLRLPAYSYEKNFGGIFYIFLRGVNPQMGPDFGIYRAMPAPELINALRENLISS